MFPSRYSSRYNSPQSIQDSSSIQAGASSSASSSRPQQTLQGGALGYSSRTTYLRDTVEQESENDSDELGC